MNERNRAKKFFTFGTVEVVRRGKEKISEKTEKKIKQRNLKYG